MSIERDIAEGHRAIVARLTGAVCHSGVVKTVDTTKGMAMVQLTTATADGMTVPVLLNATNDSALGVTAYPTVGSDIVVASVDGNHLYVAVLMSQVDKLLVNAGGGTAEIEVTNGKVVMNGGSYGGLVKVEELVTKLNRLENVVNGLIGQYNAHTHGYASPGGPALTAATLAQQLTTATPLTNANDLKNDNVKH